MSDSNAKAKAADSAGSKRRTSSGDETRARIVEAALATLKAEGIVGTSARAIARQGDFNPVSYTHLTLPTNREV